MLIDRKTLSQFAAEEYTLAAKELKLNGITDEKEIDNILSQHFRFSEPSKEFVLLSSLSKDLYREWILPFENRAENQILINFYIKNRNANSIDEYFDKLCELNPELLSIPRHEGDKKEYYSMLVIIGGAISSFCYDDIFEYITIGDARTDRGIEYDRRKESIESKLQQKFYWVPSHQTVDSIYKELFVNNF